jgi:hypothetical protein
MPDDLGFSFHLWNGAIEDDERIGIDISCGAYSKWTCNFAIVGFPDELGSFENVDKMSQVLETLVRSWEPEWAQVASENAANLQPFVHGKLSVDWMLYLCRDRLPNGATLHWPARVIPVGGNLGATIITQDEPPDPRNPEHAANVDRARKALGF